MRAPIAAVHVVLSAIVLCHAGDSSLADLTHLETARLQVLVYDQAGEQVTGPSRLLFTSLRQRNVSLRVGSLSNRGRYRGYQDRLQWLQQELPRASADVVMHVDGRDTMCLCESGELLTKHAALLGGREGVIISGERQLWPDEGRLYEAYRGKSLQRAFLDAAHGSTRPAHEYVNNGFLSAQPSTLLRFFACMQERFPRFPDACPRKLLANGDVAAEYDEGSSVYFPPNSWHGPFNFTHGVPAFDVACFTMYYLEHRHGALRRTCPPLVVDVKAELILGLTRDAWQRVKWQKAGLWPRINYTRTGSRPCILHAAGPNKYLLNAVKRKYGQSRG